MPWIFHSWLSGVIFAAILSSVGIWGAVALNITMAAAPFAILYNWWRNYKTVSSLGIILFSVAIFLASARFRLRTEMFSMFFLSLVATFILTEHKKLWHYVGIACVFALWPNLHGAVLMGLVVLWAGTLAELAQFRRAALPLLYLAMVCSLCVFLFNPWGFGYAQTWSGLDTPLFRAVNEWKPFCAKAGSAGDFMGRAHRVLVFRFDFVDRQSQTSLGLSGVATHRGRGVFCRRGAKCGWPRFSVCWSFWPTPIC